MVLVTPPALLSACLAHLQDVVRESFQQASLASRGFALRVGAPEAWPASSDWPPRFDFAEAVATASYGGVPAVALAGFALAGMEDGNPPVNTVRSFLAAVDSIRGRPSAGREQLLADDVALLGIADGLCRVRAHQSQIDHRVLDWLITMADAMAGRQLWSARMRALAADLLDGRGRLRADPGCTVDGLALEMCLRRVWTGAFRAVGPPSRDKQQQLTADLLTTPPPVVGELDRAAVWIGALRTLTEAAAIALVPGTDEVVRILRSTQHGLKRWVWDDKPRRANVATARWMIDDESHIQSFLWAVLYPHFGEQLRDEQYLPGFGQLQPRYDFGIENLKLIIEVKLIRTKADFKRVEEEVAGDTGIYFSDLSRYDRLVAYVYDDCDRHHPELYDGLRNALMQRDQRILDVVVVRRPGMIPPRNQRTATTDTRDASG